LKAALAGAKAMQFIGLNLTVPHKLLALEMVDELDASARAWGAVNTVRFEARDSKGDWRPIGEFSGPVPEPIRSHGFNTDAEAIVRALREELSFEPRGARVLLLGAGGAGRAAALKLASEGVSELFVVNRTARKALDLQEEISERYPAVKVAAGYPGVRQTVDLLLNATALGLQPDDLLPLDTSWFSLQRPAAVYDLIYRTAATPLFMTD